MELDHGGLVRHPEFVAYRARDAHYAKDEERLVEIGAMHYHLKRAPHYADSIVRHGFVETSQVPIFTNFANNLNQLESQFRDEYGEELGAFQEHRRQQAEEVRGMYGLGSQIRSADPEFWKSVALHGVYVSLLAGASLGGAYLLTRLIERMSQ